MLKNDFDGNEYVQRYSGLLLDCLKADPDDWHAEWFEQLESAQDWDDFILYARRHSLAQVLYHKMKQVEARLYIPDEPLATLRQIYFKSALQNRVLFDNLDTILAAFAQANIPVILLKGAYLARFVYPSPELRPMADVDLLVNWEDLAQADKIVVEQGYQPSNKERIAEGRAGEHHHLPVYKAPGKPSIEVHWTLASPKAPYKIDISGLWRRARPIDRNGPLALAFNSEDLLLHLCIHACYSHRFARSLQGLYDIVQVLQSFKGQFDWQALANRAEEWGVRKPVYLTLYLAQTMLGAEVSEIDLSYFQAGPFDDQFLAHIKRKILSCSMDSREFAQFMVAQNFRRKMTLFLQRLFLPPRKLDRDLTDTTRFSLSYLVSLYGNRYTSLLSRYFPIMLKNLSKDEMPSSVQMEIALVRWLESEAPGLLERKSQQ